MAVCQPIEFEYTKWPSYVPALTAVWYSAHKKLVEARSRVQPSCAVAVAPFSFLAHASSSVSDGTVIAWEITSALGPGPGAVMNESIGGPVVSEPDTAKTCTTNGAGLVRLTGTVCGSPVPGAVP